MPTRGHRDEAQGALSEAAGQSAGRWTPLSENPTNRKPTCRDGKQIGGGLGGGGGRKEGSQRDTRTFWGVMDVPTLLTVVSRAPARVEIAPAVHFKAPDQMSIISQ